MESPKVGDDAPDLGTVKSEVEGVSEMIITDMKHKNIGRGGTYIICYDGTIKLGSTDSQPIKATIFAFQCDADEMPAMHKKWSSFDHPSVMKSLGCSWGSRHHSKYGFVAFPMFHLTFSDLIAKGSRAVEMGRFTEVFTEAVSQIVKGLQALHDNGFFCPNLKGADIAIKMNNNSIDAKIWNFTVCTSDVKKNMDWKRLGDMLRVVAERNFANSSDSLEIHYVCYQISKGQIRGLDILQQSAFLSVREKFEKVLFLWTHVSIHCKPKQIHPLDESKSAYTLTEFLDANSIESTRPLWIGNKRIKSAPKTLRNLLDELRDIIEHEVEYIPSDVIAKLGHKEIELDIRIGI
ncbi:uncharacterized protein [Oryza sativa Japonica Group]|uniref:uncharacterized protein isoform X2 n=1 Tax=Oryza sativa subsp. japonica TaxID=39947 RepID=UPI00339CEB55